MENYTTYFSLIALITFEGYAAIKSRRELYVKTYNDKQNFKKLKRILNLTSDAISICDKNNIIYINKALGYILSKHTLHTGIFSDDVYLLLL